MTRDLFAEHQEVALRIARAIGAKLPRNIERDDLEQAALIGLHKWCTDHPDSSREGWRHGLNLRVRGAVIDWVRGEDYLTRGERAKGHLQILHLEDLSGGDGPDWQNTLGQLDPSSNEYSRLDALAALEAALPERERQVVVELLGGRTQRELALDLGVSEPRVSQLVAHATDVMRSHIERDRRAMAQVVATPQLRVRDFKRELWLARRDALWQRMEPGMSMRTLALKLRISETTVYHWCTTNRLTKFGSMSRRDPISAAVRRRGRELIASALRVDPTGAGAASLLKISSGCIWAWRRRLLPDAPICRSGKQRRVDWGKLRALYEQGLSQRQIAEAVGLKKAGVGNALRRLGVPPRYNTRRRQEISTEHCRRLRAEGLSLKQCATKLRCSIGLVRGRLKESR